MGLQAVAVLRGKSKVEGKVYFTQESATSETVISWDITGHNADTLRGMHIHAFGDVTNGCTSAGPHFNPFDKEHGCPKDLENRHVGDLGNIKIDEHGNSTGSTRDSLVTLHGEHSIIGRSVVVHAGTDDLGKGGESDSKTTGHAGDRSACGIIGLTETAPPKL